MITKFNFYYFHINKKNNNLIFVETSHENFFNYDKYQ